MTPDSDNREANESFDADYEVEVEVRLRDVDFMGHVNNATYATYLEQAREAFFTDVFGTSLVDLDTVLANVELNYERPIEADATVIIALAIGELGTASLPMRYEIRADGVCAATASTVQVFIDRESEQSRPIPDAWRTQLEQYQLE
ncbi:thioesterase superfamily protein [Natrialba chahannaoensis JCM 10990]|uniref:Thioesterase superfamily protein n=1 Tax=Natrialba chahannaoensis JCM 10990 TaxID=1227492 RepID=M0AMH6_9EURY|nr:thioesterase family protein [Natrialba chahannaoensis]ELY99759.1 thioesterase superfamily protein [Natrialba chahannaoensis JCM 10990]